MLVMSIAMARLLKLIEHGGVRHDRIVAKNALNIFNKSINNKEQRHTVSFVCSMKYAMDLKYFS